MTKFVPGDRVMFNCDYLGSAADRPVCKGATGTVERVFCRDEGPTALVTVSLDKGETNSCYAYRLDLISMPAPVEIQSDKGLADKYRRLRDEANEVRGELESRGFKLFYPAKNREVGQFVADIVFRKEVSL